MMSAGAAHGERAIAEFPVRDGGGEPCGVVERLLVVGHELQGGAGVLHGARPPLQRRPVARTAAQTQYLTFDISL